MASHSKEGVGHHGLRLKRDVQLPSHISVYTGANLLQLIPCMGTRWVLLHHSTDQDSTPHWIHLTSLDLQANTFPFTLPPPFPT